MILFRITVRGLGARALPVARRLRLPSSERVKTRTLQGEKTIGMYIEAIAATSDLRNLMYLSLSPYPGLGSALKRGLTVNALKPQ